MLTNTILGTSYLFACLQTVSDCGSTPPTAQIEKELAEEMTAFTDNKNEVIEEDTPAEIILDFLPDVLVKGGDYTTDTIVGADTVIANGGTVETIPLIPEKSTTALLDQIIKSTK